MDIAEITLLVVGLNCLLTVWAIRVIGLAVETGISQLDQRVQTAIQSILQGDLMGSLEPPNPIQAAIAQMLTNRIETVPVDLARGPDGKFSP